MKLSLTKGINLQIGGEVGKFNTLPMCLMNLLLVFKKKK